MKNHRPFCYLVIYCDACSDLSTKTMRAKNRSSMLVAAKCRDYFASLFLDDSKEW